MPAPLLVTLRQYTPIIHFQHEQSGATLRATELKPKLDRFLLATSLVRPEWQLRKPHDKALDYQVRVEPVREEIISSGNREFQGFFGNMGKTEVGDIKKYVKSANGQVQLRFSALDSGLLEFIRQNLANFFSWHNFGTRQTKGFGCFYIAESDPLYWQPVLPHWFTLDDVNVNAFESLFKRMDLFYRSLRSGINIIGPRPKDYLKTEPKNLFYFKSLLFKYAKDGAKNQWGQSYQWEKKTIKQHFYKNKLEAHQAKHPAPDSTTPERWKQDKPVWFSDPNNQNLVKDLFGLASEESWLGIGSITKKHDPAIDSDNVRHIDRFASPILFKPVWQADKWYVYFGVKPNAYTFPAINGIPTQYLGEKFQISAGNSSKLPVSLSLPQQFDIDHYLKYLFNISNFDISTHVEAGAFQRREEYTWLKDIYTQLQSRTYP